MTLQQDVDVLRRIPLFAKIEPARLKLLAFTSEHVEFQPGEPVCRQGEPGDSAYIVLDGAADVVVQSERGPMTVAHIGRNDIVGEIAILCDVPRTATVLAKTPAGGPAGVEGRFLQPGHPVSPGGRRGNARAGREAAPDHHAVDRGFAAAARA